MSLNILDYYKKSFSFWFPHKIQYFPVKAESSRGPSSALNGADGSLNSLWCGRSGTEYFFFGRRYQRMQTSSGQIKTREFNKPERVRSLQPQRKQSASFSLPLCFGRQIKRDIYFQVESSFLRRGFVSCQPVLLKRHSFQMIKMKVSF